MSDEPDREDDDSFFDDEDIEERMQRNLNNAHRRKHSTVSDESVWLDNIEQAYEDSISNTDPID